MEYITEQMIDRIASETGARLKKEKKVSLIIAPENGAAYWEGGINGHFFRIKTGVPVSVPESLYRVIAGSAHVRAESEGRLSRFQKDGGMRIPG